MSKKALIISCFNWYKTRLKPVRELLIAQGFDTTVLIADFEHATLSPIKDKYKECTYISVPHYKKHLSLGRIRSHLAFGESVGHWLHENAPDLIYCQVPPNNVADYCRKYKASHPNTKLILDIIDLWPESMPIGKLKSTPPAILWKKWRDNSIKASDYVFTECNLYQEQLRSVLNFEKTSTLYLYKVQTDAERKLIKESITRRKADNKTIRFAFLGSMNNILDIDGIYAVIQHLIEDGFQCELHAIGGGERKNQFERAVKSTGCQTFFYGYIFDEFEKIRILAPCDFAFNMMKDDISVGLTIKSIDYLSYGLPLINNIKGDTWKMVENNNIGVNISSNIVITPIDHQVVLDMFKATFSEESFIAALKIAL